MMNKNASYFLQQLKRIPGIEMEYALAALGASESLYEKLLTQLVRLMPSTLASMDDYLLSNDLKAFAVKAHGLKGSLKQAGCRRLASAAEKLEKAAKTAEKPYCSIHYPIFKEELILFCERINAVFNPLDSASDLNGEISPDSCLRDFRVTLEKVRAELDDFDSLAALDTLSPLLAYRFGKDIDDLIVNARNALSVFKPQKALEYITALLDACERSGSK